MSQKWLWQLCHVGLNIITCEILFWYHGNGCMTSGSSTAWERRGIFSFSPQENSLQAPASRPEVSALWAWLRIQLAFNILQSQHNSPISESGGPEIGGVSNHRELMDSMQFWSIFEVFVIANKGAVCIDLLLEASSIVPASTLVRWLIWMFLRSRTSSQLRISCHLSRL